MITICARGLLIMLHPHVQQVAGPNTSDLLLTSVPKRYRETHKVAESVIGVLGILERHFYDSLNCLTEFRCLTRSCKTTMDDTSVRLQFGRRNGGPWANCNGNLSQFPHPAPHNPKKSISQSAVLSHLVCCFDQKSRMCCGLVDPKHPY